MKKKQILTKMGLTMLGVVIGTGIMMNDQAYTAVKGVFSDGGTKNMIGFNNVYGFGGNASLGAIDIETALMMVQQQRSQLLEQQLKTQLEAVQDRNKYIAELNLLLNQVTTAMINPINGNYSLDAAIQNSLLEKGVPLQKKSMYSMAEMNAIIERLKSLIDSNNSSQQMDMLRMQSLTNKRNEAFDLMTNFIKKMQDSRSSIIGNMR